MSRDSITTTMTRRSSKRAIWDPASLQQAILDWLETETVEEAWLVPQTQARRNFQPDQKITVDEVGLMRSISDSMQPSSVWTITLKLWRPSNSLLVPFCKKGFSSA